MSLILLQNLDTKVLNIAGDFKLDAPIGGTYITSAGNVDTLQGIQKKSKTPKKEKKDPFSVFDDPFFTKHKKSKTPKKHKKNPFSSWVFDGMDVQKDPFFTQGVTEVTKKDDNSNVKTITIPGNYVSNTHIGGNMITIGKDG